MGGGSTEWERWEKSIAGTISNADEGGFVLPPNIVEYSGNIVESQCGDAEMPAQSAMLMRGWGRE